jgi:glycosyltransferase involved in cell wall biosynthesis
MESRPLLSVVVIAYNQEKYIAQTLESICTQVVDFKIEVIVGDDGSTDDTRRIIKEYVKRYPNILRPVFRKKNLGPWANFVDAFKSAQGKYIALCEGDDFWTDSTKLQKQVDLLEKNPDAAICFHKATVVYENGDKPDMTYPDVNDPNWYTHRELFFTNYIPTASVVYRRIDYTGIASNVMPGDWYLHLYHAKHGRVVLIDETMSVYRKHDEGIWREFDIDRDQIWRRYGLQYLNFYSEILSMYEANEDYQKIIVGQFSEIIDSLLAVDEKYHEHTIDRVLREYSELTKLYMKNRYDLRLEIADKSERLTHDLLAVGDRRASLEIQLAKAQNDLHRAEAELNVIRKLPYYTVIRGLMRRAKKLSSTNNHQSKL